MYWSKTKQHLDRNTRGEKLWAFLPQIGTYIKHTSRHPQKTQKIKPLEQEDVMEQKRSLQTKF